MLCLQFRDTSKFIFLETDNDFWGKNTYLYLDTLKYVDTAGVQGSYNEKLGTFFSQKKKIRVPT